MKRELILNESYGEFVLGAMVSNYLKGKEYEKRIYHEKDYENECYTFEGGVELWCEGGIINTIRCDTTCYYKGHNLIGLRFMTFLTLINSKPTEEETIYLLRWRDRVRTILIYDASLSG